MLKRFFISMLGSLAAIWISFMLLMILGMVFAVSSIVAAFGGSSTSTTNLSSGSILCLTLDSTIEDRKTSTPDFYSMLNETNQSQSLSDIIAALSAAKDDDKIEGLYIECVGSSAGIATRQSIRNAILDFRQSGKWVVAYAENYSQGDYYIASAASDVFLNPVGMVEFQGLASSIPFMKGLFDKLGVEMQVVKVGTYKSAVEPYILTGMSEANRLQVESYLGAIWSGIVDAIAESRDLTSQTLNQLADSMIVFSPTEDFRSVGLVDQLKYSNEVEDYLKELTNTDADDDLNLVDITEYLATDPDVPNSKKAKKRIAVYYALGDITESGKNGIASDRVVPDILDLADDDDVDALVLRVNSGGGSAFASEQIWHALEVFKGKGKPFYVSMGDVAASGGYYISCGAEKIYAEPLSITGSIGIFGMIPCVKGLLSNHLGVNIDFVRTNANSGAPNLFEPLTPFQRQRMQTMVNNGYELFTRRCAEGRGLPQDSIKAIGEGRVWDGVTAQKIGLVDELGSLQECVAALATEYNYPKYQIVEYPNPKQNFWDILSGLSTEMKLDAMRSELGPAYPLLREAAKWTDADPVQARIPFELPR